MPDHAMASRRTMPPRQGGSTGIDKRRGSFRELFKVVWVKRVARLIASDLNVF